MKNKEIQEARMRQYFIQAAGEILKGEGIAALSVRNVADKAGYSFATIYNYFRDVNELVFHCVNDFQEECRRFAHDHAETTTEPKEKLKKTIQGYVNYFIQYPGIFELYYLVRVGDFGNKQSTIETIGTSLDSVCQPVWNECRDLKIFDEREIPQLKSVIRHSVIGMMLLYINRRIPQEFADFQKQLDRLLGEILG
jgi:AcrR family transcriptional regulator